MHPRNPFFPRHTMVFKGGGGGGGTPETTVTSTPPPPTTQSVEVQMAQRDAARKAAKQKGFNKTILAGETGGYRAPISAPDGGATLLGNGVQTGKNTLLGGN